MPQGKMRIGLYPGTFDPVTNGHMDIIGRAVKLVDRLVIGVAQNDDKGPLFSTAERVEMVRAEVARFGDKVEVRPFSSLLMHFAEELDATSSCAACAPSPTSNTNSR
jgi:pantetheine-phosphate adenylyltransferase